MAKFQHPAAGGFPFDLGTTQAARTLIRAHQLLRGELLKHQVGEVTFFTIEQCRRHMRELEATLRFLHIDFDQTKLKPKRARPKIGPLGYGEIRTGVLKALKDSAKWMAYREIADAVLRSHGLALGPVEHKHFLQMLREATLTLKKAGAVVCEHPRGPGKDNDEQRWRLSPMFD